MNPSRGGWQRAVRGAAWWVAAVSVLAPGAAHSAPATATERASPRSGGLASPLFAIVVGNNQPEGGTTPTLRYADDDAVSTHKLLIEAGVRSVLLTRPDEDTRRFFAAVTPDGLPRGADFDAAVARVFAEMRGEAARGGAPELFVFYSGHGDVAGGEGYVLLEDRRLMRRDLYDLLSRSPAVRNHVFVDACKSYFLAFERGPGGQRVSYTGAFAPAGEPGRLDNVGFVLSTSSDRDSHEWERFQGGILSHELRSALRGAADADRDGRVTYAELGAFVASANRAIDNPRFRPDVLVRAPGRDLRQEVLRWRGAAPVLRVTGGDFGHLYVENPRGERVLDAHPPRGQMVALHLPPERPMFVRRHDGGAEVVIADRVPAGIASLAPRARDITARGALQLAFEQFFASPFEPGDVASFEREQGRLLIRLAEPPPGGPALEPATGSRLRSVALVVGAGALVGGLALSGLALQRWLADGGDGGSQKQRADDNRFIHRADVGSLIGYGVAAVAGATWGWLTWKEHAAHPAIPGDDP